MIERSEMTERVPPDATIRVAWLSETGSFRIARVRILGIWEDRIQVALPELPHRNTMARLKSDAMQLDGHARLLWYQRNGFWYQVELEFIDGMRWTPPDQSRFPAETRESAPTGAAASAD